ncbi:MAG: DUF4124 domain-containing protein [Cocleimonas sp.]
MINKSQLIILSLSLAFAAPAIAKIYKWVDAKGKTHYTSQPPSVKTQSNEEVKIKKIPKSSLTYQPRIAPAPVVNLATDKKKNKPEKVTNKRQNASSQCKKLKSKTQDKLDLTAKLLDIARAKMPAREYNKQKEALRNNREKLNGFSQSECMSDYRNNPKKRKTFDFYANQKGLL